MKMIRTGSRTMNMISRKLQFLSWLLTGLYIVFVNWTTVSGHVKLNVPRVRLPYFDNLSINFTLQVDTPGCYRWTASRSDVITITYIDEDGFEREESDCSDRAVISTVPRVSPCCPANAIVYAEEVNTKEIVRCDVIIDRINSINIVTTTKELHLEEAPSKFNVRGYGGMNNEFSTMEGVALRWWLESHTTETSSVTDPQSIMRFIPFSESMYKASPALVDLEAKRLQGSQVLVEGLRTGSVNVFAKISDPLYKNIAPAQVRIVVVANLMLDPHEVFVVPGTIFHLKLLQMKHGKFIDIKLPSAVYSLEVLNETVVTYEPKRSTITARSIGETKIVVTDKNCLEGSYEEHALTAYVHVREPKFLSLTVHPFRNWALMMAEVYEISVEIYDSDNQKILIGDNILVKTTFEPMFFNVHSSSSNGTYHVGTPIKSGSSRVIAELIHIRQIDGSLSVPKPQAPRVQTDLNIFQRIAINPKETILPWNPSIPKKHEISFTASGGNGNFAWKSTNSSVVTVTQGGKGRMEFCGFANVTAAMTINLNIKGEAKVYVLPPIDMKIVEHVVEAEVGTPILIPLAFYTVRPDDPSNKQVPYSSCKDLPFEVEVEDKSFRYDAKTHYPHAKPSCAYLPILSSSLGSSLVTITYATPTQVLSDSVIVSAFRPLKVVEPSGGSTVLTIGSSRQLVFEGGPRPLLEHSSGFFRKLLIQNETVAQSYEFRPPQSTKDDLYIYEVICREIGETLVTLHTGNSKHLDDSRPVSRTAEINVICAEPEQIYFKVETKARYDGGSKCPNDISIAQMVRIPIPNYENTMISVVVKDGKGRKFDNITSLEIGWRSSLPLVTFANVNFITTQAIPVNGYTIVGKNYQSVIPVSKSGNIEITAEIKGYRAEIFRRLHIKFAQLTTHKGEPNEENIQQRVHSMDLQLVSDFSVNPSEVTLFNHPSSKSTLRIDEGSGYFSVISLGGSIDVKYFEDNKTISIIPFNDGDSKIIVKDLCLFTHRSSEIVVQVNGVNKIDVDGVDKLQLLHETIVGVTLFDKNGNKLSEEHLGLINLKPNSINADILDVTLVHRNRIYNSRIEFLVRGKNIGQATLSFTAESPGSITQSPARRITVFPPLTMTPDNITILVGSVYQLVSHGGPQLDVLTNFSIDAPDTAEVSVNGLIEGKSVGRTKIHAKSVDRIPSRKIYSEDTVSVNVLPLIGIRIHAPLMRIQKNHEMPLWAVPLATQPLGEGLDPSILLGGDTPLISLEWQVNNIETAEVRQTFQNGYIQSTGDRIAVRLRAKQPGQVSVKLIANYSGVLFVDEIDVEVHDELHLVKFSVDTQPLLMTPNSELNLKTNRDTKSSVSYHVKSSKDKDECKNGNDAKPIVTVDSNGIVRSFENLGQAVIFISVREHFGILQTITVTVEVKSVSYIMINPQLPISLLPKRKTHLPRGLTFPFSVTYHDNMGTVFSSTSGVVNVRPNRFDLAQVSHVENQTFVVQSLIEGRLCVKVFDKNYPLLMDYLILSFSEAIYPPETSISVGDVICFSCGITSNDLKSGFWVIEPKDVMFLDSLNGFAVPLKAHELARLEYHIEGVGMVTSRDVSVKGISQVKLDKNVLEFITNGDSTAVLDIEVSFGEKDTYLYGSDSDCPNRMFSDEIALPFSCEIEYDNRNVVTKISDTFSVQFLFVPGKDRYFCRIKPVRDPKYPFYVSSITSKVLLKVRVSANAIQTNGLNTKLYHGHLESSPVPLNFLPAVFIPRKDLHMTNKEPYTTLLITGHLKVLDQLKFICSDGSNLKVNPIGPVAPNVAAIGLLVDEKLAGLDLMTNGLEVETRSFLVKLSDNFWISGNAYPNLSITVISTLTKQRVLIQVELRLVAPFNVHRAEKDGWLGTIGFFADWGFFLILTPTIVMLTLLFTQLAYKYHLQIGSIGNTTSGNDTVFITNPKISPSQGHRLSQRSSSTSPSSFDRDGCITIYCLARIRRNIVLAYFFLVQDSTNSVVCLGGTTAQVLARIQRAPVRTLTSHISFRDGSNLTRRLYSTQDTGFLSPSYRNLQHSTSRF